VGDGLPAAAARVYSSEPEETLPARSLAHHVITVVPAPSAIGPVYSGELWLAACPSVR